MTTQPQYANRGIIFAIFVFSAIAPFILMAAPVVAQQLALEWQLRPSQVGLFFFFELGTMSLSTIPAYYWIKKVPFRRAIVFFASLFIIGNILSIFAKNFELLLMLRVISAWGGGSIMIITLTTSTLTPHPEKTYGFWNLGQVLLGALSLYFLPKLFPIFGLKISFMIAPLLMLFALTLYRYFPDQVIDKENIMQGVRTKQVQRVLSVLATLTIYVGISGIWTFMSSVGIDAKIDVNFMNSVFALSTLIGIAGCFLPALVGHTLKRPYFLMVGYLLFASSITLLYLQINAASFAAALLLFKFSWMFSTPFVLATVASLDYDGRLMNTVNLVIGGGLAVGPLIAGRVIENTPNMQFLILYSLVIFILSFFAVMYSNRGQNLK